LPERLTWCEISRGALAGNLSEFRRITGPGCRLAPVVKSNAYGHGLVLASRVVAEAGADALCVNDLWEAARLREAGTALPIHCLGYIPPVQAGDAAVLNASLVLYDEAVARALDCAGRNAGRAVDVHIKVETGTNRQGLRLGEALRLAGVVRGLAGVRLAGLSTHFADIEDTTDHAFARSQIDAFQAAVLALQADGHDMPVLNVGNTAATILWPEAHMDMVRVGIGAYGMWPSKETFLSAALTMRDRIALAPALTWKTRVVQLKDVPTGDWVSYGRTFRTTHATRLAVLPIGYYDGYDRGLSNTAYVLVRGRRAQVRGRVCMNMVMVDVTDVPGAEVGDEVVLLGRAGGDAVTAEQMATWAGTINYEVTTRIAESVPRIEV
jgi:alanine racemase